MLDDEFVCRVILFPRYYDDDVYAPDAVMNPEKVQNGVYALSVGSRTMLPLLQQAHDYGNRVAEIANTFREEQERIRGNLLRDDQRQVYVAFYDILARHIRCEETEMHRIEILHVPERGQEEHYEIRIIERENVNRLPKADRVADRGEITRLLMERFWGACPFADSIDIRGEDMPILLPDGGCGPCRQNYHEAAI